MKEQNKKWSGRFDEPVDKLVQIFTASVDFDQRLALYDIQGSLAHAEMLKKQKIISATDFKKIETPKYGDRIALFSSLAYNNWTLKEMANGTAWRMLNES